MSTIALEGKIPVKEKLAFSSLNFGNYLMSTTLSTFLLYYYTDIALVPVAAISVILLVVRLFDGFIDPFIGYYMDRRRTRFGKYKGYVLYWTVPLCAAFALLFLGGGLSGNLAIGYCFVIYLFWSFSYSMIEVSRNPLMISMSDDRRERQWLNTSRVVMGIVVTLIVQYVVLELSRMLGKGAIGDGFTATMILFAAVALITISWGGYHVQERRVVSDNSLPMGKTFAIIFKNKRIIFVLLMYTFNQLGAYIKAQGAIYYMKYSLEQENLTAVFMLVGVLSSLLTQPLILWLAKRVPLVYLIVGGSAGGAIGMLFIGFAGESLSILMASNIFYGITSAFPANLMMLYIANIADDFSKDRDTSFNAVVNSLYGLASRLASSVAGASIAFILFITNYQPNQVQSERALLGIQVSFILLTCLAYVLSGFFALITHTGRAPKKA